MGVLCGAFALSLHPHRGIVPLWEGAGASSADRNALLMILKAPFSAILRMKTEPFQRFETRIKDRDNAIYKMLTQFINEITTCAHTISEALSHF